jgi:hypothetical protein
MLTEGPGWWLADSASTTLFQNFRCLQIIALTSGWKLPLLDQQEDNVSSQRARVLEITTQDDYSLPPENFTIMSSPPCEYTLDVTFGVSMTTLRCLNKIHDLIKIKNDIKRGEFWPDRSAEEFFKLEAEIFDALDEPDGFSAQQPLESGHPGISDYVSREIMENHVWAFHYSTAIFLRRALCDGQSTIKTPRRAGADLTSTETGKPTAQYLVAKALEHLENVDALSSEMAIANTLWPGFIAAVEAVDMDLRHRALIWFGRAKRHGIGNIAKAKALVMEVWRRVDRQTWAAPENKHLRSELGNVDWREVMQEKGMYIMLT